MSKAGCRLIGCSAILDCRRRPLRLRLLHFTLNLDLLRLTTAVTIPLLLLLVSSLCWQHLVSSLLLFSSVCRRRRRCVVRCDRSQWRLPFA